MHFLMKMQNYRRFYGNSSVNVYEMLKFYSDSFVRSRFWTVSFQTWQKNAVLHLVLVLSVFKLHETSKFKT